MTDKITKAKRSRNMSRIRSANTSIEMRLRSALWKKGLRGYRVHLKNIPGKPDVVFPTKRLAVFVDGCFWHACATCYVAPKSNTDYWRAKIDGNRDRDERVNRALDEAGWLVLRFWEHEVEKDLENSVRRVAAAIKRR